MMISIVSRASRVQSFGRLHGGAGDLASKVISRVISRGT